MKTTTTTTTMTTTIKEINSSEDLSHPKDTCNQPVCMCMCVRAPAWLPVSQSAGVAYQLLIRCSFLLCPLFVWAAACAAGSHTECLKTDLNA